MSRCGRCKGRGYVKELHGLGIQPCPGCEQGVKKETASLGKGNARLTGPVGSCVVCGDPAIDWHHVIAQQRIKRFVLDTERKAALEDRRNLIAVCRRCHDRIEHAVIAVDPILLPNGFPSFVAQYDLQAALPRHLTEGSLQ